MTDRELIEAAAKAIGLDAQWFPSCQCLLRSGSTVVEGGLWNPMQSNSSALDLLLKLRLSIESDANIQVGTYSYGGYVEGEYASGVEVWFVKKDATTVQASEVYGNDPGAATRRAIVRCAAMLAEKSP